MSVLPLIDALLFFGWSSLVGGFLLKAIYMTTHYRPTVFGLYPNDFLLGAAMFLLFALALAARTWVKAVEPELLARRRRAAYEPEYGLGDARGVLRPLDGAETEEPHRTSAAGL